MILLTKRQIDKRWIKYERDDPYQQLPWDNVITKAQLKKVMEWLNDNGARFLTEVEGHEGFYELDWSKFELLIKEAEDE